MSETPEQPKKDLAYYLTLFKIEGHTTWRAHLSQKAEAFQDDIKKNWNQNPPTVTEKMVVRIDRVTGTFML